MTAQPIGRDEYRLGREIADLVENYAPTIQAKSIVGVEVDGDRIAVTYGVRTGPDPEHIHGRVCIIDARTSEPVSDDWEA